MTFRNVLILGLIIALLPIMALPKDSVGGNPPLQADPTPTVPPALLAGCNPLGQIVVQPAVDETHICPEYLVQELPRSAIAAITSIAFAPPCDEISAIWCGALFFVRPDAGKLMWIGAFDPELGTYTLHTFAEGLDTPNGLVWHDHSWYVSGNSEIYRITDADIDGIAESVTVVVNDLPKGPGGWTGSIAVGPDNRLYVSKAASCNMCEEPDPRRAAILSYELDGSDEQTVATGLHNAFDFAWTTLAETLWITESEYPRSDTTPLDEINILTSSGQDFGWPFCMMSVDGMTQATAFNVGASYCQQTTGPAFTLPAHSVPSGLVFYHGDAFPAYEGDLLVVLQGSADHLMPRGYNVTRLCLDSDAVPETCHDANGQPILDEQGSPIFREIILPHNTWGHSDHDLATIQGQGFYPEHPVDIAISPEGYILVSIMEGRIIRLLPRR